MGQTHCCVTEEVSLLEDGKLAQSSAHFTQDDNNGTESPKVTSDDSAPRGLSAMKSQQGKESLRDKVQKNVLGGLKDGTLDKLCQEASTQEGSSEVSNKELSGLEWAKQQKVPEVDDQWAKSILDEFKKEPAWATEKELKGLEWARAQNQGTVAPTRADNEVALLLRQNSEDRYGEAKSTSTPTSSTRSQRLVAERGLPRSRSGTNMKGGGNALRNVSKSTSDAGADITTSIPAGRVQSITESAEEIILAENEAIQSQTETEQGKNPTTSWAARLSLKGQKKGTLRDR